MPGWGRFFDFCFPKKIEIIYHEEEEYTPLILSGMDQKFPGGVGDVKTKEKRWRGREDSSNQLHRQHRLFFKCSKC